jgi:hypothetical protein
LRNTRRIDAHSAIVAPFNERQGLVGKPGRDALEKRT